MLNFKFILCVFCVIIFILCNLRNTYLVAKGLNPGNLTYIMMIVLIIIVIGVTQYG